MSKQEIVVTPQIKEYLENLLGKEELGRLLEAMYIILIFCWRMRYYILSATACLGKVIEEYEEEKND